MKQLTTLIAVTALVLAACGGGDDTGGSTPSDDVTTTTVSMVDPDAVIVRIDMGGGFVPIEYNLNLMAAYLLTGDGTLYSQGPMIEIYPGPMLPNIQRTGIGADGVEAVLDLVEALGLPEMTDEVNDEAAAFVADAGTTSITYFDDTGSHRYSVYALGISEIKDQRAGILGDLLLTLQSLISEGDILDPYTGDRVQVWVAPGLPTDDGLSSVQPWPLPMAAAEVPAVFQDFGCVVLQGDDAAAALTVFAGANQLTLWEEGADLYRFLARPLLPGEDGCVPGGGGF